MLYLYDEWVSIWRMEIWFGKRHCWPILCEEFWLKGGKRKGRKWPERWRKIPGNGLSGEQAKLCRSSGPLDTQASRASGAQTHSRILASHMDHVWIKGGRMGERIHPCGNPTRKHLKIALIGQRALYAWNAAELQER